MGRPYLSGQTSVQVPRFDRTGAAVICCCGRMQRRRNLTSSQVQTPANLQLLEAVFVS